MSKNGTNTLQVFIMAEHEKLNIYTFNANGLGNFKKKKDVFDFLRNKVVIYLFYYKKLIGRLNRKI